MHNLTGKVFIVGAGPGDPDLITVKGLHSIQQADVILYDRLAPAELLDEAPAYAELIDVGKAPKQHRRSQDEINALLVEKAYQGKTVVRLKGGDPFVFGRGGEECLALREAGVEYEIIPGVSSAIAVPAYAGIPVTQRGVTTAFTVVAGHVGVAESDIDWSAISKVGTLVFLMGVEHLVEITEALIKHGRSAETPAAVIENGTTQNQNVVIGTLSTIAERSAEVLPPAILIVGEVVNLQAELDWFIPNALEVA
ncbi:MAG: uroporphyrinogen-III C-methyltransferase [Anaerolineales bacterium]|nr:uroporphyrinogen-III C-methyltransferase [Anaerolineales bacterium]